jgi:chromosome segregation protein
MSLLKSLELHGYKTFASRTLFEFPGDVTAIVGPNGSGKSNIADALRWVLGEQSYSLLRGRKTEDMIFSGSEMRPRAGMASATITFDNENGWLPIDFSEVSITRRAYRDGTNEYLLNGQRVRLKEISEMLAQSGLAERTYTIIGQGLVDAALSLKPEERRRFFEEAAGIGLFRARREESLNRLDATRRNLERVLDILSELEPRLRSLERQAKRAMEYDHLRTDLRVLLRDWYGYHWNRSQVELVRSREVVRVQEERLNQVRERQTEVEGELNRVRTGLQELRGKLNGWHNQSAGLHTERERVSRALAVMDERQLSLSAQKRSAESDLARLEEEQKARQDRLAELEEERTRLQEELKDAGERAAQAQSAVEKRQSERGQLETRLRETRRALLDAETRQVQVKARVDELTNRLESLRASRRALEQGAARDAEDMSRAQARLAQWVKNREQAESELNGAEENLRKQRQAISVLDEDRRQAQETRARLDTERSRLVAQTEVLEQAERSLSGLATGARYILQEASQGRLKGGYRPLSSALVVPADLEVAVAAALGEFLDSVLIEKGVDLEDALQSLGKGEQGRAVLLPLNETRKNDVLKAAEGEGCLGVAAELIQAPVELQDAVRLLLGQVLVARDRTSARKLARTLPETARVVTLQGEVFLGNGVVVAGRESKTSGLIGRTRRIQEMRQSLDETVKTMADAQQRLKELEENIQRQRSKEKEQDGLVRQAQSGLSKANQGYQQAVLETEQVRQKQDYQARQLAGLVTQLEKAEEEIRLAGVSLESGTQKVREFNEQVREFNRGLSGLPLEELQAEMAHWTTSQAVSNRAVREADRRQLEQAESLSTSRKQAGTLQERVDAASAGLSQLESERATAHVEEAKLNQQIEALQVQIDPAEEQLKAVEVEADRVQDNLVTAQQAVSVAERHATQAQLEFGRCRDGLDSLRRKVEEDFGLVAFEYSSDVSGPTPLPLDGMVEQLPNLAEIPVDLEDNIARQRALLRRMGPINPEVQNEYRSVKERFEFLTTQVSDLRKADTDLRQVIAELDELMKREFRKTFDAVAREFHGLFTRLFGGGSAHLILSDAESTADMGIDIEARLPGRRDQGLSLLSGGERSLTAVALIFSLLKVSPTPFCVMDEVDAMLDEANVGRFRDLLLELAENTQFVLVTHNRNTVQAADVIYGVTMGHDSASQVISLRLDELSEELVK